MSEPRFQRLVARRCDQCGKRVEIRTIWVDMLRVDLICGSCKKQRQEDVSNA